MIDVACDDGLEEGEIEAVEVELRPRKKKEKKNRKNASALEVPQEAAGAAGAAEGQGYFNVYGNAAVAGIEIKTESPIRLVDVQGLVLWTLAEAISPRWVFLKVLPAVALHEQWHGPCMPDPAQYPCTGNPCPCADKGTDKCLGLIPTQNKPLIKQLVLVLAHGLSPSLFNEKLDLLPNLQKLGKPVVVTGLNAHAKAGKKAGKRKLPRACMSPPWAPCHA